MVGLVSFGRGCSWVGFLGAGKLWRWSLSTSSLQATHVLFASVPLGRFALFFCCLKAIPRPHRWCQLHRYLARWYEVVDRGSGQHGAFLGPAGRAAAPAARLHLPGEHGLPSALGGGTSWPGHAAPPGDPVQGLIPHRQWGSQLICACGPGALSAGEQPAQPLLALPKAVPAA